jgi:hypothetical protein
VASRPGFRFSGGVTFLCVATQAITLYLEDKGLLIQRGNVSLMTVQNKPSSYYGGDDDDVSPSASRLSGQQQGIAS